MLAKRSPLKRYELYESSISNIVESSPGLSIPDSVEISSLTPDHFDKIDNVRPGYSDTAKHYLSTGHEGFCIWNDGQIAALAWMYYNESDSVKRTGYFSLKPNHAWFHADWTVPRFRGEGMHKYLIRHRAFELSTRGNNIIVESNIASDNTPSKKNYQKFGFDVSGQLLLLRFGSER
ncbi:GNAT family N-acetyltransferase [Natrarchaeobius oligotrophus]|uniref:GNAT family N-acetyltransferase n=1 Tax=Natrarchaeobius chitinivorans TaxID=1679083 RepID=A0A3N6LU47_NATCH|nr:GNAT family N-acetyltransferase [Natrarchaeobius chitinivorans]RQG93723.1 GNAT family N-acetyltransferase [Natrarchaeobius chitinivorans]